MQVAIAIVPPNQVSSLPLIARQFLEAAVASTPLGDLSAIDVLAEAKAGEGLLYLICVDGQILGITYIVFGDGINGKLMNIVMLGGAQIVAWKDAYHDYMIELARMQKCKEICIMGRDGLGRLFPDLQRVGSIFTLPIQ